ERDPALGDELVQDGPRAPRKMDLEVMVEAHAVLVFLDDVAPLVLIDREVARRRARLAGRAFGGVARHGKSLASFGAQANLRRDASSLGLQDDLAADAELALEPEAALRRISLDDFPDELDRVSRVDRFLELEVHLVRKEADHAAQVSRHARDEEPGEDRFPEA